MANPQQPGLRRSGQIPALSPDATKAVLEARRQRGRPSKRRTEPSELDDRKPGVGDNAGSPPDRPDLDAVAEQFGIPPSQPDDNRTDHGDADSGLAPC